MSKEMALKNAKAIVRDMRERLGNERFLYSENMFLVATSEALGNLEHYLKEIAREPT